MKKKSALSATAAALAIRKEGDLLKDTAEAQKHEWLETNGLGGFAGSTIVNLNTRRYHGLLVAAVTPPTQRMVLLSKLDETICIGEQRFELGCNNYGEVFHPQGHRFQSSFSKELFPEFTYEAGGVRLKKTIAMIQGENTTLLLYEVLDAPAPFTMELLPLVAVRDYHSLTHANDSINSVASFSDSVLGVKPYADAPEFFVQVPGSTFSTKPNWYYHFNYSEERLRGLDFIEDLFSHGNFTVALNAGDTLGIIVSTQNPTGRNATDLLKEERKRRMPLISEIPGDKLLMHLALSADQFLVKRGDEHKTIIAGYHWFTDWGRDTMISLPGLCLSIRKFDEAKKILAAFADSVSMGMLPNRFLDKDGTAEYNNVDGTLWFFIAIYRYLLASGDEKFVLKKMLPVLKEIIEWHRKGTRYRIHEDDDGLLWSGEAGVQLTWMDAKVGDWVVTPRTGKAVEVNALWYNALCILADLLKRNGESQASATLNKKLLKVREQFVKTFMNEESGTLYDVDAGKEKDASLRPNQLFAIGLPFPLIEGDAALRILSLVTEKLYTPVGLRSLSPDHPQYRAHYGVTPLERDGAYHQGTVWSWLLGIYIDSIMKTKGRSGRAECIEIFRRFGYHLEEAGIGCISEIFDGDAPHVPGGCIAQAWSVGELLRAAIEHRLYRNGHKVSRKRSGEKMRRRVTAAAAI